ncbi:hypothetical protein [Lacrimispora xylanisolvens]|uniref:hypothetical protein n=1 Tax=Lacrimispora xylanisolvens TaxID=384636 RepID=UPI0024028F84
MEIQKSLVKESDRTLFEDVLANTVSKKIRYKIYKSESWVEKMNRLMGSMNTSSGLKLSLVWKKKKAEEEGQLDTRELVELLKGRRADARRGIRTAVSSFSDKSSGSKKNYGRYRKYPQLSCCHERSSGL